MKLVKLFCVFIVVFLSTSTLRAIELRDEIYKFNGEYKVVASDGLRVYYPKTADESITRILYSLATVRNKLVKSYPSQKDYKVIVLLTDNDDRISSSSDPDRDWITIGMFEEMDSLSTRAYSLQKRFALRLSNIYLLRSLGSASNAFKRELAVYAIPQWFIDGLTLNNAFPLDSIHYSRLLDMARNNRLYSLSSLDTIVSQPTLIREEMQFQAHSMISMWESKYKKGAGLKLLKNIFRNPTGFRRMFRKYYGKDLKEAYNDYAKWIIDECGKAQSCKKISVKLVEKKIGGKFFTSLKYLGPDEKVWVSSKRYFTESYDLYYQKGDSRPRVILKNVHPAIFLDKTNKTVYIGKYWVTGLRQRRLGLWSVKLDGKAKKIADEAGSFKALGKKFGRIFYTSIKSGITRIMSVDPAFPKSIREEYKFPVNIRPLDLALDKSCQKLYFTCNTSLGETSLAVISISKDDKEKHPLSLFTSDGDIAFIKPENNLIWFAAKKDFSTNQLFSLNIKSHELTQYSKLPGGVWDYTFKGNKAVAVTLDKGEFWSTELNINDIIRKEIVPDQGIVPTLHLNKVRGKAYVKEYRTNYWKPVVSKDEDGLVFGVYSYRTDQLDRSSITFAPTYGYKSNNWGYEAGYMQRIGLLKVNATIKDQVRRKYYFTNEYYERDREKVLDFNYPFNLSTSLSFGMNLNKRGIARIPDNNAPYPSVGRDHSLYASVTHRAIRTEPYWKVFPRKGRRVQATYEKGTHFLDGELIYDTMSLKWDEYIPVKNGWVTTLRGYVAEDDKENNLRKPDDLTLGGNDYMRAYDGAFRSGDSLRTMSMHLGHPINFQFPKFMGWIKNEFLAGEIFWEAGDVKSNRHLDYVFDRGAEIRMQALLFKRIPVILRFGAAYQNGGNDSKTYFSIDTSQISGFIK